MGYLLTKPDYETKMKIAKGEMDTDCHFCDIKNTCQNRCAIFPLNYETKFIKDLINIIILPTSSDKKKFDLNKLKFFLYTSNLEEDIVEELCFHNIQYDIYIHIVKIIETGFYSLSIDNQFYEFQAIDTNNESEIIDKLSNFMIELYHINNNFNKISKYSENNENIKETN